MAQALRRRFIFCILGAALSLEAGFAADRVTSPDFLISKWDSDDGLPTAIATTSLALAPITGVMAIARTPDGYLWLGTDHGLVRFDGVRFVVVSTNDCPALAGRVTSLLVDRAGELWAGTREGTLIRRRAGGFDGITLGEKVGSINGMRQDSSGALWLATQKAGMVRCSGTNCEFFSVTDGLSVPPITQLVADKAGRLWAIAGTSLMTLKEGRWQALGPSQPPAPVALAPSMDGGLWAATTDTQQSGNRGGQVFKLKDGRWVMELAPYAWPQDTVSSRIVAMQEDGEGRLWVATYRLGFFFHDATSPWQVAAPQKRLQPLQGSCFALGSEGVLWAGTRDGELIQFRSHAAQPVQTLSLPSVADKNLVLNACAASDGSVWLGTDGAGLFRYRDGSFTCYTEEQGLGDRHIGVILEDSKTNLLVGTWNGLFRRRRDGFEQVPGPASLRGVVLALCEDHEGGLWVGNGIGNSAGVTHLGKDRVEFFGPKEGVDHAYVRGIAEDKQGRIWLAVMDRGLYMLQNGRFERFGVGQWAGEERIRALHADAGGTLWSAVFGTGLVRLKDGKFTQMTVQDGLPSEALVSITEDKLGNLWFSSFNGVFGCPKARLEEYCRGVTPPLVFWHPSTPEGLEIKKCTGAGQPVVGRGADGRLWVPNWESVAVVDTARVMAPEPGHPLLMEEVLIDGEPQSLGPDRTMRVRSGARNYEFHYTLPDLDSPERARFRYQLRGADPGWVEADRRRVAYYGKLAPGTYEFRVMASGANGSWQEAPSKLRLAVLPRLWERRGVQAAILFVLLGAMALGTWWFARIRLDRRLASLQRQQEIERERSRIARDMHDEVGVRLTQISLLSALASKSTDDVVEVRTQTNKVAELSRNLVRKLDEIVWAVRPQNDNLESLVDYLAESLQDLCNDSPLRLWFSGPSAVPAVEVSANVRHHVLLACSEAVNNAIKHSGATEIRVGVCFERTRLRIEIADNGHGFDVLQAETELSGLLHLRQRLTELGGSCEIQSARGKGTRIVLALSLDAKAARAAEPRPAGGSAADDQDVNPPVLGV
jgi:signal transduction histidine kinase/ligand-binding sensor domain-containing protein